MGRENEDPTKVGSSIVLLQERFKQLQRSKEMRRERQLLKLMSQSTESYDEPPEPSTAFSPSDSAFQDPLALGLNSGSGVAQYMPRFQAFKPHQLPSASRGTLSNFFETPHDVVDTSLRL